MIACGSCAGGCDHAVRVAYARAGWLALRDDIAAPDCGEWRERYWRGPSLSSKSPRPPCGVGAVKEMT
jgi:hypothetical protein